MAEVETEEILIDQIVTEGMQTRASIRDDIVEEYVEVMQQGIEFPSIELYSNGTSYWLVDGFHRVKAAQKVGRDRIAAVVRQGSKRDALLYAVGRNEIHGLRRTNSDRRTAVLILLEDNEWSKWSDRDIADKCAVSHTFVNRIRHELHPTQEKPATEEERTYTRKGKTQTMRTKNIGAAKRRKQTELQEAVEVEPTAEVSTVNRLQLDEGDVATKNELPSEITPATSPAPVAPPSPAVTVEREIGSAESITVVAQEPPSLSDVPPESLPTAVPLHKVEEPMPSAATVGRRITVDLHSSAAPSVEVLNWLTLEKRWDLATAAEQRGFVAGYYDELQKMLKKLERQKASAS